MGGSGVAGSPHPGARDPAGARGGSALRLHGMDPLAHTLAGAALAQAGLKRLTPLAAPTIVIAANLPDVDAVATLWGGDVSLCVRRGWTHGVLAMVVLPFALCGLMLLLDRLRRRGAAANAPAARAAPLVLVALLATWTHPVLDWLNTYGVRLLMPFSGRWFYGDALFIIDPWIWLMFGAAAALATTRRAASIAAWTLVATAASVLLLTAPEVPPAARGIWLAGILAIALLRWRWPDPARVAPVARACATAGLAYCLLMLAGTAVARARAERWLADQGRTVREVMAGPLPANPFVREIIAVHPDRYAFYVVDLRGGGPAPFGPDVFIASPTPVTEAARHAPSMRGLDGWLRFPSYEVVAREGGGYQVTIRDVRYSRYGARARGIGQGFIELDANLRPVR